MLQHYKSASGPCKACMLKVGCILNFWIWLNLYLDAFELFKTFYSGSLANSEDPDEMPH